MLFAEHREAISRGSGRGSFSVACLHYPTARPALKSVGEGDLGASKRSRHVNRARDRTPRGGSCTEPDHRLTEPIRDAIDSRRMRNVTGDPFFRVPRIRSSPVTYAIGRRSLKSRAETRGRGDELSRERVRGARRRRSAESFPSAAHYSRDYSCVSGHRSPAADAFDSRPRIKSND